MQLWIQNWCHKFPNNCLWSFICSHSYRSSRIVFHAVVAPNSQQQDHQLLLPGGVDAVKQHCQLSHLLTEGWQLQTTLSFYLMLFLSAFLFPIISSYSSPSFFPSLTPFLFHSALLPPSHSVFLSSISLHPSLSLSPLFLPPSLSLSLIYRSHTPEALTHTHPM